MGEIGWYENRDEALKRCERNSSGDKQMDGGEVKLSPIITGLDKLARIQSAPFNYYYSSLAHDLMESEYVIVAGYGMGDIHINKWITQARLGNPNLKIIIVDYWNGPIVLELTKRIIEIIHSLRVDLASGTFRNGPNKNWVIIPNSKAAIWTNGFQAFLNDTNLSKVLKSI